MAATDNKRRTQASFIFVSAGSAVRRGLLPHHSGLAALARPSPSRGERTAGPASQAESQLLYLVVNPLYGVWSTNSHHAAQREARQQRRDKINEHPPLMEVPPDFRDGVVKLQFNMREFVFARRG